MHALLMQNRKMHNKRNAVEEEKTKSTKSIRVYSSTHQLLWQVSKADNRPLSHELDYLVGERFKVLKEEGRVSD